MIVIHTIIKIKNDDEKNQISKLQFIDDFLKLIKFNNYFKSKTFYFM